MASKQTPATLILGTIADPSFDVVFRVFDASSVVHFRSSLVFLHDMFITPFDRNVHHLVRFRSKQLTAV